MNGKCASAAKATKPRADSRHAGCGMANTPIAATSDAIGNNNTRKRSSRCVKSHQATNTKLIQHATTANQRHLARAKKAIAASGGIARLAKRVRQRLHVS